MTTLDPATIERLREEAAKNAQLAAEHAAAGPPADVVFFMSVFTSVLSGLAHRGGREEDNISSAMNNARLAVGQFVLMGLCMPTTKLADGTMLAKIPNAPNGGQQPQVFTGPQTQGNFSHQFPTLPQARITT